MPLITFTRGRLLLVCKSRKIEGHGEFGMSLRCESIRSGTVSRWQHHAATTEHMWIKKKSMRQEDRENVMSIEQKEGRWEAKVE